MIFPSTSWQHLTAIRSYVSSKSSKFTKGSRLCWPSSSWWSYLFGSNLISASNTQTTPMTGAFRMLTIWQETNMKFGLLSITMYYQVILVHHTMYWNQLFHDVSLRAWKWDASPQATIQMLELCRFFGNAARPTRLFASPQRNSMLWDTPQTWSNLGYIDVHRFLEI